MSEQKEQPKPPRIPGAKLHEGTWISTEDGHALTNAELQALKAKIERTKPTPKAEG